MLFILDNAILTDV